MSLTRNLTESLTKSLVRSLIAGVDEAVIPTAGNKLWLDLADDSTYTLDGGDRFLTLNDKSPENVSVSFGANKPIYSSFDKAMYFDSGSDNIVCGSAGDWDFMSSPDGADIFIVFRIAKPASDGVYGVITTTDNPGLSISVRYLTTTFRAAARILMRTDGNVNINTTLNNTFTESTYNRFNFYHSTSSSPNWNYINSNEASGGSSYNNTPVLDSSNELTIGRSAIGVRLSEVIIYDRVLSAAERTQVQTYLDNKWKYPFPSGGLFAQYDYSSIESRTVATGISELLDGSGNDNTISQPTASLQPTVGSQSVNGLDTAVFDGTDDYLVTDSGINEVPSNFPLYVFCVIKTPALAGDITGSFASFGTLTSSNEYTSLLTQSSLEWRVVRRTDADGTDVAESGTVAANTTYLVRAELRSADDLELFVDGISTITDSTSINLPSPFDRITSGVNARGTLNGLFEGEICETLYYKSSLTSQQISDIEDYLNNKWGL